MAELIDARTITDETLETSVCVIGGGPMGLAVSIRLSELGISHLVLESGGRMPGDNQDLTAGETTGHPYDELDTTRIRALGGTTHIWGGHSKPLRPEDFVPRPHIANSGWPISHAEHQKYIGKAAELVGLENRWRAEDYSDFSSLIDPQAGFFDFEAFKLSQVNYNPSQWARGDFFETNKGRIDTRILLHATARELVFAEDGTVSALTVIAGEKTLAISARIFVLACGGIENARFLLVNQRKGNSPLKDLPAIGRYFMEHPHYHSAGTLMLARPLPDYFFGVREAKGEVNQMRYFLKEKHQHGERLLSAMFYPLWPSNRDADFAAPVRALRRGAPAFAEIVAMAEQAPDVQNRVTLSPDHRDRLGDPVARLHFTLEHSEYAALYRSVHLFAREVGLQGLGWLKLNMTPPHQVEENGESGVSWGRHHMGTTRMGTHPASGVVDADCRILGIPNLYVGGTSVFPTGGCVNPTMNAIALCLRIGEDIARRIDA